MATFQVRIHGRGGQGVVTAAELLSVAAFNEGKYAQAVPSFGSERTGAPIVAFCRIADQPIRSREPIIDPDALIIQDPTLLHSVDVFSGLHPDGYVLLNSSRSFDELGLRDLAGRFDAQHLLTVPATELAMKYLGKPLPNAVLLGGFAAISGVISLSSVVKAIEQRFAAAIARNNVAAAESAYQFVRQEMVVSAHA